MTYRDDLEAAENRIRALSGELDERAEELDELKILRDELRQKNSGDDHKEPTAEFEQKEPTAPTIEVEAESDNDLPPLYRIGLYWSRGALLWLLLAIGLFAGSIIIGLLIWSSHAADAETLLSEGVERQVTVHSRVIVNHDDSDEYRLLVEDRVLGRMQIKVDRADWELLDIGSSLTMTFDPNDESNYEVGPRILVEVVGPLRALLLSMFVGLSMALGPAIIAFGGAYD